MRQFGVADKGFIRRIEQNQRPVLAGVLHPGGQLRARGRGPRGVVRKAQVDQIDRLAGQGGHIAVGGGAVQIDQAGVAAIDGGIGAPGHDVGIHIHRVHRIGDGHAHILGKNFLDVAGVGLGPVADEDFIGLDLSATGLEVVRSNRLAQKVVALLRAIAAKAGGIGHLVRGLVQRGNAGGRQRLGHVANAQADQVFVRVLLLKGADAPGDVGKQIAGLQLGVVGIDADHGGFFKLAG